MHEKNMYGAKKVVCVSPRKRTPPPPIENATSSAREAQDAESDATSIYQQNLGINNKFSGATTASFSRTTAIKSAFSMQLNVAPNVNALQRMGISIRPTTTISHSTQIRNTSSPPPLLPVTFMKRQRVVEASCTSTMPLKKLRLSPARDLNQQETENEVITQSSTVSSNLTDGDFIEIASAGLDSTSEDDSGDDEEIMVIPSNEIEEAIVNSTLAATPPADTLHADHCDAHRCDILGGFVANTLQYLPTHLADKLTAAILRAINNVQLHEQLD